MKIRPLNDRVVVRRKEAEEKSAGGILLSGAAKEKPTQGEVLAVGPGKTDHGHFRETTVKAGDTVLFGQYAGQTVKIDGEELIILSESEIYGIVEA